MKLMELFDNPIEFKRLSADKNGVVYKFQINKGMFKKQTFIAAFTYLPLLDKNAWKFTFGLKNRNQIQINLTNLTGKDTFSVFATIYKIIQDFIQLAHPHIIAFTANMNEPSRVKLYDRFVKRFEQAGWEVTREEFPPDVYYNCYRY